MSERMRGNVLRGLVAAAASVLMLMGLSAAPAQAEPSVNAESSHAWAHWRDPSKNTNGGVGEIRSLGENIVLEDFYKDGWGTRGQLQLLVRHPDGYQTWENLGGVCFDDTSTGNTVGGRTVCERNVPEGRSFRLHVWASQSGTYKWHSYTPFIVA